MNSNLIAGVDFYITVDMFAQHLYDDLHSRKICRYILNCLKGTPRFDSVNENHIIYWRFKLEERANQVSMWKQSHIGIYAVRMWARRVLVETCGPFPTVEDVVDAGLGFFNEKVVLLKDFTHVFD